MRGLRGRILRLVRQRADSADSRTRAGRVLAVLPSWESFAAGRPYELPPELPPLPPPPWSRAPAADAGPSLAEYLGYFEARAQAAVTPPAEGDHQCTSSG